jgi:hypothetical protein
MRISAHRGWLFLHHRSCIRSFRILKLGFLVALRHTVALGGFAGQSTGIWLRLLPATCCSQQRSYTADAQLRAFV